MNLPADWVETETGNHSLESTALHKNSTLSAKIHKLYKYLKINKRLDYLNP